ncbi:MAG: helix-turn-helix domain-containing protein, partial [Bacteroidota bacterium]
MSYILQYIQQGEHLHQDFKMRVDSSQKIARSLVAFANSEGGRLLIGVKDNGSVCGISPNE